MKPFYSPIALLLPLTILATGCTHWPAHGQGGLAEHTAAPLYPIEIPAVVNPHHDNTLTVEQGLRLDSDNTRQQLDTLVLQGGNICFPAAVYRLNLRQIRIERQLTGGLSADAAIDVLIQRKALDQLRQQLAQVNPAVTCALPQLSDAEKQQQTLERISLLLNADNQFAIDSAAINPKYAARLAKAAQQLQPLNQIKLTITGHTDINGTQTHNQQLAAQRAQAVASFLTAMGIELKRLTITAAASEQPYSQALGPEHRLVNRRVLITLTQAANQAVIEQP